MKKTERYLNARFTVEAALLMGMILPMLAALLLAGFFVHDNVYLQEIACEGTALAGAMTVYEDSGRTVDSILQKRRGGLLWSKDAGVSVSVGRKQVSASAGARFRYILSAPFLKGEKKLSAESTRKLYDPAALIRKVRGAKALLGILEEGN